jgi:predicted transcriptional regulator
VAKEETFTLRLDRDIKARLRSLSKQERLSMSAVLTQLILKAKLK